jgi:hypothetical protein
MKLVFKASSVLSRAGLFFSVFIFISAIAIAQKAVKTDSTVSTYLHIKGEWAKSGKWQDSIIGFILNNIDTLGKSNWKSKEINEFERDKNGFFLKADIPVYVSNNSSQIWCTSISLKSGNNRTDTIRTKYGGVKLSKIKLLLNSTPEGAESYLIPNRVWLEKFANTSWDKDDSKLEKFRVNTSSTNTYAYVDQTVFVVIFKLNDKYKKLIHFTKPASIQQEQPVWIKF